MKHIFTKRVERMRRFSLRLGSLLHLAWYLGILWTPYGCSFIGPQSIANGRAAYNEVINRTEDQQMLMAIVRNRYGETISMLAVTNVTASLRIAVGAGAEFGIGREENYEGELTPLSGEIGYEESPTISYAPIEGEEQFNRLMSPVPLDVLVLFARSVKSSRLPLLMITRGINDLRNPNFIRSPFPESDPRFLRLIDLIFKLNQTGHLEWARDPSQNVPFSLVIRDFEPKRTAQINELLTILDQSQNVGDSAPIVLPVFDAIEKPASGGIAVTTNSIYDLIEILSASIDVPEEHQQSGLAISYPTPGIAGNELQIFRADERPRNASVAVKYRHSWFYIDEADQSTKLMFRVLRTLWKDRIASTIQLQSAPVLTIPVGN